jgi:fructoselysine-6-P-deglycase FrlB-like protein
MRVDPITATELSGFHLRLDMSDTLIVAVSQSGTTTDTNRTVDLARGRGASVLAIVNRRNSDLTDKADGVMYTSDGRDVEMSVASTKAFYAQVAAGVLLACAITEAAGGHRPPPPRPAHRRCASCPPHGRGLARRDEIAEAAAGFAPFKRYWAIVGNGPNAVAAEEVRIKLSELCYKSIACDVTEDKKHIDLSSEPLILVCAAGLVGGTADDVAKEVAIYKAHKATPIVIATEADERFAAALAVLTVPSVDSALAFVLSAMVGHLFGYEAALAIDASARRCARRARSSSTRCRPAATMATGSAAPVQEADRRHTEKFLDGLRAHSTTATSRRTAVRLAALLRDLASENPLEAYQRVHRVVAHPACDRRPHRRAHAGDRGAHPPGRRHQAPGEDGHRRHQPQRRGRARPCARAGGAGSRRRPRPSQLPHAQGARRSRPGRRREVVGYTRYRIEGDPSPARPHLDRRPGRHVARRAQPGRAQPAAARHQAPRGQRARGAGGPWPQRRPHRDLRARGEGRHLHRHHAAARAVPRPAAGRHDAWRAAGLRPSLRPPGRLGDGDRGHLPRRPAWPTCPVADLLILPISETADHWRS